MLQLAEQRRQLRALEQTNQTHKVQLLECIRQREALGDQVRQLVDHQRDQLDAALERAELQERRRA